MSFVFIELCLFCNDWLWKLCWLVLLWLKLKIWVKRGDFFLSLQLRFFIITFRRVIRKNGLLKLKFETWFLRDSIWAYLIHELALFRLQFTHLPFALEDRGLHGYFLCWAETLSWKHTNILIKNLKFFIFFLSWSFPMENCFSVHALLSFQLVLLPHLIAYIWLYNFYFWPIADFVIDSIICKFKLLSRISKAKLYFIREGCILWPLRHFHAIHYSWPHRLHIIFKRCNCLID